MNRVLFIIVIFSICLFIGCEQAKKDKNKSEYLTVKDISKEEQHTSEIDSLIYYYKKTSSEKVSDADFARYVYTFPSTFQSFQDFFGFDDKDGEMPLYKEANAYIDVLFQSSTICCKHEVLDKIINIAKDGKWDADAVNYLKHKLHEMIKDNPNDLFEILSQKEQRTQVGFWFFYYDSPHPEKEISQRLLEKITRSRADVNALKEGFNKVLKQGVD